MRQRILSTLILWAVVVGCVQFLGLEGAVWLVCVVAVLTLREFYQMVRRMGLEPFDKLGLTLGAAIMLAPYYTPKLGPAAAELATPGLLLAASVIGFALRILGERQPHNRVETLAWSLFGVIYVPFMLSYLTRIATLPGLSERGGLLLVVWVIAVSKFCDVGALLTGLAFGRNKMAPGISPKKTWEGAVGGVLVSAGVGAGLASLCAAHFPAAFTPWVAAVAAAPVAMLAIVSDLVESIIKRRAETKDSGATIPGIGGVFDLSDSLIFTAPFGYAVFTALFSA